MLGIFAGAQDSAMWSSTANGTPSSLTPLSAVEQTGALEDWVAASGKNPTTIYASTATATISLARVQFYNDFRAPALFAAPDVLKIIRRQASP